jgi:hypothetical protein
VPAGVRHSVKALTDGRAIIVDFPVRPEFAFYAQMGDDSLEHDCGQEFLGSRGRNLLIADVRYRHIHAGVRARRD